MDTLERYTAGGQMDPARAQLHSQIVDKALAGHSPQAHPAAR